MADAYVTCASRILCQPVRNRCGLSLGEIEELMIDPVRGFIVYAVLVHRGRRGEAGKRFAIPWGAFSMNTQGEGLCLNVEPEMLHHAPGLTCDETDDAAEPQLTLREASSQV